MTYPPRKTIERLRSKSLTLNYIKIFEIFETQFRHLEKYRVIIRLNSNGDEPDRPQRIGVAFPVVFNHKQFPIPNKFMGVKIKKCLFYEEEITEPPKSWLITHIWNPQRYESFVDDNFDSLGEALGDLSMKREAMLDALCLNGDFNKLKAKYLKFERRRKIPKPDHVLWEYLWKNK